MACGIFQNDVDLNHIQRDLAHTCNPPNYQLVSVHSLKIDRHVIRRAKSRISEKASFYILCCCNFFDCMHIIFANTKTAFTICFQALSRAGVYNLSAFCWPQYKLYFTKGCQ